VSKEWFWNDVTKESAEQGLAKLVKGQFLVRLSTTVAGSFTISKVSKKGKINHQRIDYAPNKGFSIRVVKKDQTVTVTQPNLPELLRVLKSDLNLNTPCPGSPFYTALFGGAPVGEGYLLEDSD
jgi:hypothetical protein